MTDQKTRRPIPADGVEFELMFDATDPMEMVRSKCRDPRGWKYSGPKIGPQIRRFKLVRVGYCHNLNEVRGKLTAHGSIPQGQWREAFNKAFPQTDGQGPIGIADPSWVDPDGRAEYPVLREDSGVWYPDFFWDKGALGERWRWLVEVK